MQEAVDSHNPLFSKKTQQTIVGWRFRRDSGIAPTSEVVFHVKNVEWWVNDQDECDNAIDECVKV